MRAHKRPRQPFWGFSQKVVTVIRVAVSGTDRTLRPSLAKAPATPRDAFGALLLAAMREPAAARGLAVAYASLEPTHRMGIVDAVVTDARAEGVCPSAVLASLLAVEEDATLARAIAEAMERAGGEGLTQQGDLDAWLAGDEGTGGLILSRPLHGRFVEVLSLAWRREEGLTHALFDPLAEGAPAMDRSHDLPSRLRFERMPVEYVVDLMTKVLWNHRRVHGTLPEVVRHFADLFGPNVALLGGWQR